MAQTNISIRMDEDLKKQFEKFCSDVGMSMTTAFCVFAKTVVRKQRIPFEVEADPFYSESNMNELQRRKAEIDSGRACFIEKTMEELEHMENE